MAFLWCSFDKSTNKAVMAAYDSSGLFIHLGLNKENKQKGHLLIKLHM